MSWSFQGFPTGENHPSWKGGITPINRAIRGMPNFRKWREDVFRRDNWTCVKCGNRGGKLHPHHIVELSFLIRDRSIKTKSEARMCADLWDINNGKTVCESCHGKEHNIRMGTRRPDKYTCTYCKKRYKSSNRNKKNPSRNFCTHHCLGMFVKENYPTTIFKKGTFYASSKNSRRISTP